MILHMDMDAFFASVEQLDNPDLKGKPVIVGGRSNRAVVSTASYEARQYGVHSAMPVFQAKRLCPQGIFVSGRMSRYKEISETIFKVLYDFSPVVEQVSIDEAYVDLRGCARLFGSWQTMGAAIQKRVYETVQLTCSVGIGKFKYIAKIASDMNKPNGMTYISEEETESFVERLPIRKIPGVGKVSLERLEAIGIHTLGEARNIPDKVLEKQLGIQGLRLKSLSLLKDQPEIATSAQRKSISTEVTLPEDTLDMAWLKRILLSQSDDVARELRKKKMKGKTITLKLTFSDFKKRSRRTTLKKPPHFGRDIYNEAVKLLDKEIFPNKIRLIGVGASGLVLENAPVQQDLFEIPEPRNANWDKLEKTMDSILNKYGKKSIQRASLSEKRSDIPDKEANFLKKR